MPGSGSRRSFLQSAIAFGCAAAAAPAHAAGGGVVFGFFPGAVGVPGMSALLKELQGRYQPDLGLKLNYVPGNSGALAIEAVHRAAPDGSTVLLSPSSLMTLLPQLRKLPAVDPVVDIVPVAGLSDLTVGFVVGPAVPAAVTNLKQYFDWVRDNPLQADFGVPGIGTVPHLIGVVLSDSAGLGLKAVAYRGFASLVEDLLFGSLPAAVMPRGTASELAVAGKVRLLAVTGEARWPAHAAVPTLRELGIVNYDTTESYGLFVSARTPADKRRELATAVRQSLEAPALRAAFAAAQLRPWAADSSDYTAAIAAEREIWAAVVKKHRFSLAS